MKKLLKDSRLVLLILPILVLVSCGQKAKQDSTVVQQKYTCPMHPQIVRDEPGSCPICKMDLVPVHNHQANDTLGSIINTSQNVSKLKTVRPLPGSKFTIITARGVVNYNTNTFKVLSSRVSGRVERLFVKYNFQAVTKGQKLMEIYSPDLASAQQELLFLKNNKEPQLLEAAKRKLLLLGMAHSQINQVLRSGKVDYTVPVFSPFSGYITEEFPARLQQSTAVAGSTTITSAAGNAAGSMGGMAASTAPSPGLMPEVAESSKVLLKEGQYINAGEKLFNVVSGDRLSAEFFIRPSDAKRISKGSMVRITASSGVQKSVRVPVRLVQPFYQQDVNYMLVKADILNTAKRWKVGELIEVSLENTRQKGNWLPKTAVLSLGTRYVAFARRENSFVPVYVQVQAFSEDAVDVGNSLNSETEVAENAWFMVDSESFIKPEKLQ